MGGSIACSDGSATQACADAPFEQVSRPPAHLGRPAGVVESAVQVVHSGKRCRAAWLVHLLHGPRLGVLVATTLSWRAWVVVRPRMGHDKHRIRA